MSPYEVKKFIVRDGRYARMINGGRCAECGTRTRYRDAALFEEYARYDDVCFDPDRFRERLKERIADAVRRAREEYGDSAEIRRIVLNANTSGFFDEYTDRMEIDGVSYTIHTDGDLFPANSDEYEGYSFGAWYTPHVYERVVVYPRYYIDREGIGRREADNAPGGSRNDAAATALYRKYDNSYYFLSVFQERVREKFIRRDADNDDPERRHRVIRQRLEREFDDRYDRTDSRWRDRFGLRTGIPFDADDDGFRDTLSDMPAEKLAELVRDTYFDPDGDLPGPEITAVGAFAGGSFDRLRDVYRETFKEPEKRPAENSRRRLLRGEPLTKQRIYRERDYYRR